MTKTLFITFTLTTLVYGPLIGALIYTSHLVWAGVVWLILMYHTYIAINKAYEDRKNKFKIFLASKNNPKGSIFTGVAAEIIKEGDAVFKEAPAQEPEHDPKIAAFTNTKTNHTSDDGLNDEFGKESK